MFPPPSLPTGLFLSFEGIDGSGKSTQAHLLTDALRERGFDVVAVREPGGTALGEAVRSLLLSTASDISPRAEALLFSAARAQVVSGVIEPALARGAVVIADRFVDSTMAYQGAGRGLDKDGFLESVSAFATGGRMPVRTYVVATPVDVANGRRASRDADRMESAGDAFQERVAEAYRRIAENAPSRVLQLDGRDSTDILHETVLTDTLDLIERLGIAGRV